AAGTGAASSAPRPAQREEGEHDAAGVEGSPERRAAEGEQVVVRRAQPDRGRRAEREPAPRQLAPDDALPPARDRDERPRRGGAQDIGVALADAPPQLALLVPAAGDR